jgi:argininosuccinate lyase
VQAIAPEIDQGFLESSSVEKALDSKSVPGGTAESSVRAAIAQLEQTLTEWEKPS